MRLNELVEKYDFEDIEEIMVREYPNQRSCINAYKEVISDLRELEPVESNFIIVVRWARDIIGDGWWVVSGRKEGYKEDFGLDFTDWREWLDMEIDNVENISEKELLVHILWEITFYGFNYPDNIEVGEELKERIDKVNNEDKENDVELRDWREIFRDE